MISFDNPFDVPFDRWLENVRIGKMIDERIRRLEFEKTQFAMDAKNAKDRAALLEAQVKELESERNSLKAYIETLKQEKAEISIEANNANLRGDKLEWQVVNQAVKIEELKCDYQNACAVGDNLKEQMLKMARQQENDELAIEALKAKLKRKNERIQRLEEANHGCQKGIRRLRKRITDMERIAKIHKDGIRSMRQQVSDLIQQCNQLRDELAQVRAERDELIELKSCFDSIMDDQDSKYEKMRTAYRQNQKNLNLTINTQTQKIVRLRKLLNAYRELARRAAELEKQEGKV